MSWVEGNGVGCRMAGGRAPEFEGQAHHGIQQLGSGRCDICLGQYCDLDHRELQHALSIGIANLQTTMCWVGELPHLVWQVGRLASFTQESVGVASDLS